LKTITRAGVIRALVFTAVLTVLPFGVSAHWVLNLLVFTLMYAGLATAWNLVGGYAGYVALGHVAFFGIGAYFEAIVFEHLGIGSGYTPFVFLPVIGAGVALMTLPVNWVALRTRATAFAIVTLTLVFVVETLALNLRGLTGGAQGANLPTPAFNVNGFERPFYLGMLGVLLLGLAISWWVRNSKLGLMLFAIRDDEDRCAGIGVRTTGVKLIAYSLSVGLTAMIGAVWAYYISFIYPQFAVDPLITIGMVLMVYLGGKGTLWGPVLGAFIVVPAQQYLAYRLGGDQLYLIFYAAILLVIILLLPRGILPSLVDLRTGRRVRRDSRLADVAAGSGSAPARSGPGSAGPASRLGPTTTGVAELRVPAE
jgi:branched-chain amino acid transport system permease protein